MLPVWLFALPWDIICFSAARTSDDFCYVKKIRNFLYNEKELLPEKKIKKFPFGQQLLYVSFHSYARSTFPDFKQEVQTYIFLAAPLTLTFTDLILDFHILLDFLWE